MQSDNKTKQIVATLAVLVVVVVIVFGAKGLSTKTAASPTDVAQTSTTSTNSSNPTAQTSTSTGTTSTSTAQASSGTYKNGTYSADGTFNTPGGIQSIGVKLTISNDTVTAAAITDETTDRDSQEYLQQFLSGYRSYVVGQKVRDIQLYGVSGASLTSRGFNNALAQIKNDAKA